MNKKIKGNKKKVPTHSRCFIQSLARVLPMDSILSIDGKATKHINKTNKMFTSSLNRAMNATDGVKGRHKKADRIKGHTHTCT